MEPVMAADESVDMRVPDVGIVTELAADVVIARL